MAKHPRNKKIRQIANKGNSGAQETKKPSVGLLLVTCFISLVTILFEFAGHWSDWWVKYFLVPASICVGSYYAYEFLISKKFSAIKSALIATIILILLSIAVVLSYVTYAKFALIKWQPPEIPADCQVVYLNFGGNHFAYPVEQLKTRTYAITPLGFNGDTVIPFTPFIKDGRVYLKTKLFSKINETAFIIGSDLDTKIPINWDRNYSSNVFEIVDGRHRPLLQIYYERPFVLTVNGIFSTSNGLHVAFGSGIQSYSLHYLENNQTIDIPQVKTLFKYPSFKHLGEFTE